jgi:hypothetical protein
VSDLAIERPVEGAHAVLGDAAVLIWNDIAPEGRDAFYEWHDKEHVPERLALPGFRRGRRFRAAPQPACGERVPDRAGEGHAPEWLTMYEADDVSALVSPAYLARLNAPTQATARTLAYFRNTSRAVCRLVHSLGSSTGGHVLALRLVTDASRDRAWCAHVRDDLFPRVCAATGIVACHLYAADDAASHVDTAESSTRAFDVPAWVVLCEATRADAADAARRVIQGSLQRLGVGTRDDAAVYALEICRLAAPAS